MQEGESLGRMLEQLCQREGWELLPSGVKLDLPDGRRQVVHVGTFDFEGDEFVRLGSVIGPSEALAPSRLGAALRLNAELAYGGLALRDGELVLVETRRLSYVRREELAPLLRYLAETADWYEKALFKTDDN